MELRLQASRLPSSAPYPLSNNSSLFSYKFWVPWQQMQYIQDPVPILPGKEEAYVRVPLSPSQMNPTACVPLPYPYQPVCVLGLSPQTLSSGMRADGV